ncbi:RTA1 like protein-domain-containing protein [Lenzites betulinus]|nr:RTA1 like protein-domain-containing protein [Lenzites betulinus]
MMPPLFPPTVDLSPSTTFYNVTSGNGTWDQDLVSPYYGYLPTEWTGLFFEVLFLLTTVLHIGQAAFYRVWWCYPTVILACCGEVLGWACRIWSFHSPLNITPYLIQTVTLIVSPTPLIGALFVMFGKISARIGQSYSRLNPVAYARIFITSDIGALLVQSVGGGIAASTRKPEIIQLGGRIILAGVIFQLASLTLFCMLVGEYYVRCLTFASLQAAPEVLFNDVVIVANSLRSFASPQMIQLSVGVGLTTVLLYLRAVYRTVELAYGLGGSVMKTQSLFVVLDGGMVLLAMVILNICHPGRLPNTRDTEDCDKEDDYFGSQDSV